MLVTAVVILVVLVALGVWWWRTITALTMLHARVDEAWSDVLAQLQRRTDLIPSLVASVRAYATHEETVLQAVDDARTGLLRAHEPGETADAEAGLTRAVRATYAVSDRYPKLRASTNFLQLQNELVHTEDKVVASRRFYNGAVRAFNARISTWPGSGIAHRRGWHPAGFFTASPDAAEPPVIDLGR